MTDRHNISVFERENRNIRNHLAVCCTELELLTFSCFQGGCISGVSAVSGYTAVEGRSHTSMSHVGV